MKTNFKSLTIAAAVAAASAGYAGVVNAQAAVNGHAQTGDMAVVPYYTTQGDFVTGVHIINTSEMTQVVKLRLRRATDSMDALDFNLIMSPKDEWTGFITGEEDGVIKFNSSDTTCTAPENKNGGFEMHPLYRNGADTGYIEVIAMGQPSSETVTGGIGMAAKHDSTGVPADCTAVASNFFANNSLNTPPIGDPSKKGVLSSIQTVQANTATGLPALVTNDYVASGDVLKVSYFVRDGSAGVEFGSNAVHFAGFLDNASMTNQEFGIFSGDLQGFDFPDLNGGAPLSLFTGAGGALRGKYEDVRAAIGVESVINDWSANQNEAGFTVGTDWVITVPGQYTMLDLPTYLLSLVDDTVDCLGSPTAVLCDNRDIPLKASFTVWDREEKGIIEEDGDLVVSPSIPGAVPTTLLEQEVNVIEWGVAPVLDAPKVVTVSVPADAVNGWAELTVTPDRAKSQAVCDYVNDPSNPIACTAVTNPNAPLVGFVAWERSFAANPDANYGRIIDHSYMVSSS